MAKFTVLLLMALAVAATSTVAAAADGATVPGFHAWRSRFLLASSNVYNPPLPSSPYDCSKKSPAACLAAGSPAATCCGGQCVDTVSSPYHCGGCNKVCKGPHPTCCGGRCVDLTSDKDNCGSCGNQCSKKCSYGFCDYAL